MTGTAEHQAQAAISPSCWSELTRRRSTVCWDTVCNRDDDRPTRDLHLAGGDDRRQPAVLPGGRHGCPDGGRARLRAGIARHRARRVLRRWCGRVPPRRDARRALRRRGVSAVGRCDERRGAAGDRRGCSLVPDARRARWSLAASRTHGRSRHRTCTWCGSSHQSAWASRWACRSPGCRSRRCWAVSPCPRSR